MVALCWDLKIGMHGGFQRIQTLWSSLCHHWQLPHWLWQSCPSHLLSLCLSMCLQTSQSETRALLTSPCRFLPHNISRLVFSHLPASPAHSPMWCAWCAISSGRCSSPHPSRLCEQKSKFATNFIRCTYSLQATVPKSTCVQAFRDARHHARERTTLPFLQGFSV